MNNNLIISKKGVDFIKSFEHLYLTKHDDYVGLPVIGYDHIITKEDGNLNKITLAEADKIFLMDIKRIENIIHFLVKVPLLQHQFDALVSWTYNVGVKVLQKSTLLKMLNIGDYSDVPDQMKGWNQTNGRVSKDLVKRRNSEANLFSTGSYKIIQDKPEIEEEEPEEDDEI